MTRYTAVVLTDNARTKLISKFADQLPEDFELIAHHMTINLGPAKNEIIPLLDEYTNLVINGFAMNENVVAVRVNPGDIKSKNKVPHITLAINRNKGAKPYMSNQLTDWKDVDPFQVRGQVLEVE